MNKIKEFREKRGYSQQELAEKASISRGYLSDLENGKWKVSLEIAYKLADILRAKVTDIFLP